MVDGLWQCFPVPPPSLRTITSACGRAAQVRSFVYGADVVPRLLGSDLPLLTAALERFGNAPQLDEDKHVIETLTEYEHPEHDGTQLQRCATRLTSRGRWVHAQKPSRPSVSAKAVLNCRATTSCAPLAYEGSSFTFRGVQAANAQRAASPSQSIGASRMTPILVESFLRGTCKIGCVFKLFKLCKLLASLN